MLLFKLCLAVGYPHPDYLREVLTGKQLNDWYAYASLEPLGDEWADARNAVLCSLVHNLWRGKHTRPRKPEEFLLQQEYSPEHEADDMWQHMKSVARGQTSLQ